MLSYEKEFKEELLKKKLKSAEKLEPNEEDILILLLAALVEESQS